MEYVANKEVIAKRIARIFKNGDVVNLGIGLPTQVANYLPEGVTIILQSENGMMGLGPAAPKGQEDRDVTNAGGAPVTVLPGGSYFDSATSFSIIRGGHVDYTVLGVLEVDQEGNLANYMIPRDQVKGGSGIEMGVVPQLGTPFGAMRERFLSPLGVPCQQPPWGTIAAADLRTGAIAYQHRNGTIRDLSPLPVPGIGRGRWRLDLLRCRAGEEAVFESAARMAFARSPELPSSTQSSGPR